MIGLLRTFIERERLNMIYDAGSVVFSDWEIVRKIGSGASGTVFEVQKEVTGSVMKSAVKVITIPTSDSDADVLEEEGMDEESTSGYFYGFVKELSAEIAMMGKLQGHPNIVSYEDHAIIPHEGRIGWDILIRMELLTSLPVWMKTHTMGEEDVVQLAKNLCSALTVCEEIGIIHRDIKPANVFVSEVGSFRQFKLGDFGVARTIEKTTGGLSKKGTERYMAPEVYKGEEYGKTVDIYSLGLMLYSFMNHNRLPFYPPYPETITYESRTQALVRRMRGEKMPAPDDASPEFAKIILRACAYEPGQRYQSAQEMLNDLGRLNSSAFREEDKTTSIYSVAEDKTPSGNSTANKTGGYYTASSKTAASIREDTDGETIGAFIDSRNKSETASVYTIPAAGQNSGILRTPSAASAQNTTLIKGSEFCSALWSVIPSESKFKKFTRSYNPPTASYYAKHVEESGKPVLIWFDGQDTVYWYCQEKTVYLNKISARMFAKPNAEVYQFDHLMLINMEGFDTSQVTNMEGMFAFCKSLESLDLSGFDTSNVLYMPVMFMDCSSLKNLDVSSFDTSNVLYMPGMFMNCSSLKNLDVSNFDTHNVKDMSYMFSFCENLNTLDVSRFDTRNVTNMKGMFSHCKKLTDLDVSGFKVGNDTNAELMFGGVEKRNVKLWPGANYINSYSLWG